MGTDVYVLPGDDDPDLLIAKVILSKIKFTATAMEITHHLVFQPQNARQICKVQRRLREGQRSRRFVKLPLEKGQHFRSWGVTAAYVLQKGELRNACGLVETLVNVANDVMSDDHKVVGDAERRMCERTALPQLCGCGSAVCSHSRPCSCFEAEDRSHNLPCPYHEAEEENCRDADVTTVVRRMHNSADNCYLRLGQKTSPEADDVVQSAQDNDSDNMISDLRVSAIKELDISSASCSSGDSESSQHVLCIGCLSDSTASGLSSHTGSHRESVTRFLGVNQCDANDEVAGSSICSPELRRSQSAESLFSVTSDSSIDSCELTDFNTKLMRSSSIESVVSVSSSTDSALSTTDGEDWDQRVRADMLATHPEEPAVRDSNELFAVDEMQADLLSTVQWTGFDKLLAVLQEDAVQRGYQSAVGPTEYIYKTADENTLKNHVPSYGRVSSSTDSCSECRHSEHHYKYSQKPVQDDTKKTCKSDAKASSHELERCISLSQSSADEENEHHDGSVSDVCSSEISDSWLQVPIDLSSSSISSELPAKERVLNNTGYLPWSAARTSVVQPLVLRSRSKKVTKIRFNIPSESSASDSENDDQLSSTESSIFQNISDFDNVPNTSWPQDPIDLSCSSTNTESASGEHGFNTVYLSLSATRTRSRPKEVASVVEPMVLRNRSRRVTSVRFNIPLSSESSASDSENDDQRRLSESSTDQNISDSDSVLNARSESVESASRKCSSSSLRRQSVSTSSSNISDVEVLNCASGLSSSESFSSGTEQRDESPRTDANPSERKQRQKHRPPPLRIVRFAEGVSEPVFFRQVRQKNVSSEDKETPASRSTRRARVRQSPAKSDLFHSHSPELLHSQNESLSFILDLADESQSASAWLELHSDTALSPDVFCAGRPSPTFPFSFEGLATRSYFTLPEIGKLPVKSFSFPAQTPAVSTKSAPSAKFQEAAASADFPELSHASSPDRRHLGCSPILNRSTLKAEWYTRIQLEF